MNEINPNFDPSDPANGYATNCGNTSANLNDFLNGKDSAEASTGTLSTPDMEARTGNPQTTVTPEQIESTLQAMGPGSHCVVGIDRAGDAGHWFNAYFDGDTVWSLDAQNGTRSPWPPHEPNATNWDASVRPEDVVNPDGTKPSDAKPDANAPQAPTTPDAADPNTPSAPAAPTAPEAGSSSPAEASPTTHQAPDGTGTDGSAPDGTGTDADGSSTDGTDADRDGRRWPKWTPPVDRVDPSHPSDGSAGPGTTYNGYDIPELTPEIREQLDALAAQPDSPIVRNEDGSYSLKDPIEVDAFTMTNDAHDWAEFQRQVGLQQQGLNQLTVAEWQHNVGFYQQYNRVAKTEQAAANQALAAAGVSMSGQAVLHGPDQVAGGRADRYDGAGSFGINSSLGNQWRHRIADLTLLVDATADGIPAGLRAHIKLHVEFGARDLVSGSPDATQTTLGSAQPVTTGPQAGGAGQASPSAPGSSTARTGSVPGGESGTTAGPTHGTVAESGPIDAESSGESSVADPVDAGASASIENADSGGHANAEAGQPAELTDGDAASGMPLSSLCEVNGNGASDAAIAQAQQQAEELFGGLAPENRALMAANPVSIDIIPSGTKLTDLPEYAHLAGKQTFDGRDWGDVRGIQDIVNGRVRVAIGEESLAAVPVGYGHGFVAAHEGGHGLQRSALTPAQESLLAALHAERVAAHPVVPDGSAGGSGHAGWLDPDWYSAANKEEYFANSVAAYHGHPYSQAPGTTAKYTREWLKANDPKMFALLEQLYGAGGSK